MRAARVDGLLQRSLRSLVAVPYDAPAAGAAADYMLAAAAGAVAALISLGTSGLFDPLLYEITDTYFEADNPRVFGSMTDPAHPGHYRTSVHPLFSILFNPPMQLLAGLGLDPLGVGRAMMAACGAAAAFLFLLTLRGIGLPRLAAGLFTAVFLASATYLHWFSVIETYAPAALSVVAMLWVLACTRRFRPWLWVIASTATLSMTVTNWTLALAAAVVRLGLSRALKVSAAALCLAVVLAIGQKLLYPTSGLFFNPLSVAREAEWTQVYAEAMGTGRWSPLANARSFLLSSAAAPAPTISQAGAPAGQSRKQIVSNQASPLSSYGPLGVLAAASWIVLLVVGARGAWIDRQRRAVALATSLYLAGQLCLHLVYGEITFLYAAHFFPAMALLVAFGWHTRLRRAAVAAAAIFVVAGGTSNWMQFQAAVALTNSVLRAL
jgi:hypothetical protein